MTEVPQSPISPDSNPSPATAAADPQLNHLSRLHRMSRTAGLGSSDYTAVNTAAVVSVLIGGASALALMTPVFLFLPVVGLIIAIMALVQIRRSNGTQTGLALAILGLLLSLGFTGWTGVQAVQHDAEHDRDVATLNGIVEKFGELVADHKYDDAYAMTDQRLFRDQIPLAKFKSVFGQIADAPTIGAITGMRSNGIFGIDSDPVTDRKQAVGFTLVDTTKLSGPKALRTEFRYTNASGPWVIYAIPEWFPPPAAPKNGASAPPSGMVGPPAPR